MRTSGTVPQGAVHLDDLAAVGDRPGPFLTVYLVTEGGIDNATHRSQQRWRSLRSELESAGAPAEVLDLVDPLVPDAHQGGDLLAVVADESGILVAEHVADHVAEHIDEAGARDRGEWGRAPDLVPLIRARQRHLRHVVALVDRGGADLIARAPGRELERSAGDGEPARKVHPGGWSQRRYQQRAEEDWESTASEVAEELRRLVDEVDAELVIIGGDITASHLVRDALPDELAHRTHLIEPGRGADGSGAVRQEEIRELLAGEEERRAVALVEKFAEERGQHDRAAEGVDATIDALNRSAVEVLFVGDDRSRNGFIGESPVPVALDRDDALFDRVQEVPLVDALVLAAVSTGAGVFVLDEVDDLPDGVGALLRWSDGG